MRESTSWTWRCARSRVGEKLFVDYAGQTVPVIDHHSGEILQTQIFVAVLCVQLHLRRSHRVAAVAGLAGLACRCFACLGGVPDNLRSTVSKAHRYEPDINPSYRDKAGFGVQVVGRWILAALKSHQFFSLDEPNTVLRPLPEQPYVYAEWKKIRGISTTTSRTTGIITRCPISWCSSSWRSRKAEHPFQVIKCQFGYTKLRFRELV